MYLWLKGIIYTTLPLEGPLEQFLNIYFSAIPMPSQQYFLEVIDDAIGELDQKTSIVTAKEQGFTEIVLKDKSKSCYSGSQVL